MFLINSRNSLSFVNAKLINWWKLRYNFIISLCLNFFPLKNKSTKSLILAEILFDSNISCISSSSKRRFPSASKSQNIFFNFWTVPQVSLLKKYFGFISIYFSLPIGCFCSSKNSISNRCFLSSSLSSSGITGFPLFGKRVYMLLFITLSGNFLLSHWIFKNVWKSFDGRDNLIRSFSSSFVSLSFSRGVNGDLAIVMRRNWNFGFG